MYRCPVHWFAALVMILSASVTGLAAGLDEFKVKRQEVFEFTEKPTVTGSRDGESVIIRFTSKAFCDATVAIEDADGRIVKHLVSGVLGPNAPAPFKKDSLEQSIAWDAKDDQGKYVRDLSALTVRVSLGLKSQFERTLFWSPHKRIGFKYPLIRSAAEGVYVYEGYALDHVRLFDHDGNYVRTVYPFPADKVDSVVGLKKHTFIQDGATLPLKIGYHQATLLTSGTNTGEFGEGEGCAATAMAVSGKKLALVQMFLNRLGADGSSGGFKLSGPPTSQPLARDAAGWGHPEGTMVPISAELSPDGKWVYLAGYQAEWSNGWGGREWTNGVFRMPYDGDAPAKLFVGDAKPGVKFGGNADGQFRMVTSVACDAAGRVYVGDYWNDRVQVFDSEGKHLKSIPVAKPARVQVHPKTGDIYVFSWMMVNRMVTSDQYKIEATMTHLGPLDNPAVKLKCPLALPGHNPTVSWNVPGGLQFRVEADFYADTTRVWIVNGRVAEMVGHDDGSIEGYRLTFDGGSVHVFEEADGKLVSKRNFGDDTRKSAQRLIPPILWRQRLYVHPLTGKLYVAEGDCGVMKAFNQLVELDPASGRSRLVDLPMGAEDMCFDLNGWMYLRTDTVVSRYEMGSWREIPWDYGEELDKHSFGMGAKAANLASGLHTPGHRSFNFWHLGGMDVSPLGHLLITTCNGEGMTNAPEWKRGEAHFNYKGKKYQPNAYPGRARWGEFHVYDKHGKVVYEDVVPGIGHCNGIGLDNDDNVYMMIASRRLIDGKQSDPSLPRDASGTLTKVPPGKAKVLSASSGIPVPLPAGDRPNRPMDIAGYVTGWVEGAQWFYGGLGFCTPGGCICWNSRFDLDYFSRSFAPETMHYSVAVLDSAGNLIMRVGKYGNVDDGRPLASNGTTTGVGQSTPPSPRSIGGDEVALFYPGYVASHTDRRLFIADAGNARIVSVKLSYHAEERLPLKGVPNGRP